MQVVTQHKIVFVWMCWPATQQMHHMVTHMDSTASFIRPLRLRKKHNSIYLLSISDAILCFVGHISQCIDLKWKALIIF